MDSLEPEGEGDMPSDLPDTPPAPPLDLAALPLWIVERGMRGLRLDEQFSACCQRVYDAGFPMKRVQMGMDMLHPKYGSHTFVWRPGSQGVEYAAHDRAVSTTDLYLRSPVHYMRTRRVLELRRRLDLEEGQEFPLLAELRAEGSTEYAACLVPYDPEEFGPPIDPAEQVDERPVSLRELNGIFFSCTTDRPGGFDDGQLGQVLSILPYLALAMKSRLTYDVATTVLGTYLGDDAGHRVLTGAIQRGSAEVIRAVIWFCDLRGFTQLTDSLPRGLLIEILDDYLEAMAGPVHENEGQILKFMGDGLLAIFALTNRDEAAVCQSALKAAAQLRDLFPRFNAERQEAGKPVMDFGLALHLGEVLYGNIGASDRLDFTVVGPAVNEASRIQSLCRTLRREVLISSSFRAVAKDGSPALDSLGSHSLRGVRQPQELFTLSA